MHQISENTFGSTTMTKEIAGWHSRSNAYFKCLNVECDFRTGKIVYYLYSSGNIEAEKVSTFKEAIEAYNKI